MKCKLETIVGQFINLAELADNMITRTMQRPGTRSVMGETKERQHCDWQNKMSMDSKH